MIWTYRCKVDRVIDGDTIQVTIDCGFYITLAERIRLLGIDTSEMHSSDPVLRARAVEAKNFTTNWIAVADAEVPTNIDIEWPFELETYKSDAFGRWLGILRRFSDRKILNDDLSSAGLAVPWKKK